MDTTNRPAKWLDGDTIGRRVIVHQPHHAALPEPGETRHEGVVTAVEHTPDRTSVHLDGVPVVLTEPERCTFEFVEDGAP